MSWSRHNGVWRPDPRLFMAPVGASGHGAMAAGQRVGGAAPPADPAVNGTPVELLTSGATNHDITYNLAAGTNRLMLIGGAFQASGLDFTSGVFAQGGGEQAAMTLVANLRHPTGDPIAAGLFRYLIPDGVTTGNKTIRIVSDTSGNGVIFAIAYNNIGGAPSDTDPVSGNLSGANIVSSAVDVVNTNDLVVSLFASAIDAATAYAPTGATTLLDLGGGGGGSCAIFAHALTTTPATPRTVSWSRTAGAANHDAVVLTATFPHL